MLLSHCNKFKFSVDLDKRKSQWSNITSMVWTSLLVFEPKASQLRPLSVHRAVVCELFYHLDEIVEELVALPLGPLLLPQLPVLTTQDRQLLLERNWGGKLFFTGGMQPHHGAHDLHMQGKRVFKVMCKLKNRFFLFLLYGFYSAKFRTTYAD